MNLEAQVKKGFVFYLHSINYNSKNKTLKINFLGDPRIQNKIVRILTFYNVQMLSNRIDLESFDPDCLDSLMGLEEESHVDGSRYLIITEQREIIFFSKSEPQIQDLSTKY